MDVEIEIKLSFEFISWVFLYNPYKLTDAQRALLYKKLETSEI
jgi:hypothetical protein